MYHLNNYLTEICKYSKMIYLNYSLNIWEFSKPPRKVYVINKIPTFNDLEIIYLLNKIAAFFSQQNSCMLNYSQHKVFFFHRNVKFDTFLESLQLQNLAHSLLILCIVGDRGRVKKWHFTMNTSFFSWLSILKFMTWCSSVFIGSHCWYFYIYLFSTIMLGKEM
jgi:hypothetical protein